MLLFILRHGDPIYNPDSLTEKGHLQAQALAKRLALYGIDKIYTSPLIRAKQTARPTEILLNKTAQVEEWASENKAWESFILKSENRWFFHSSLANKLREPEITALGLKWYEHEIFNNSNCKEGYKSLLDSSDEFLARHGYIHDRENLRYIAKEPNDERIAVFCHQGFGLAWLGTMLDIPLPTVWSTMDITHTGMTVIEFRTDKEGICNAKMLTMSNDSHLYKEGLPTKYNNYLYF